MPAQAKRLTLSSPDPLPPIYVAVFRSREGSWQIGPIAKDMAQLKHKLSDYIGIHQLAIYELSGLPC